MTNKQFCDALMRLYLYADQTKMIHYTTDSNHCHELCDQVRDCITKFADELAETYFGYYGKCKHSDFTLDLGVAREDDISEICQRAVDVAEPVRTEALSNDKLSGIVSLVDDFKAAMGKMAFLGTFDKVSGYTMKK